MKFSLRREVLLKPLQQVSNVVEKRQTLPVLSNLLLQVENQQLKLTATDLEVELQASVNLEGQAENGEITVPARKLHDICRSLPDGVEIQLEVDGDKCKVQAGRSRYTLSTLPASDFPSTEQLQADTRLSIEQNALASLLSSSAFAMALQDIRYFLNGMLLDLKAHQLRAVATDGHRLACSQMALENEHNQQLIVPRKAVLEMMRLLEDDEAAADLELGDKHIRMHLPGLVFTSKLIDGTYPDYESVIPVGVDNIIQANRELMIETIRRTAILSNEKYRAIRLEVAGSTLRLSAHNTQQEEAVEEMEVDYQGQDLKVVFNFAYLLDAMNALKSEQVQICLRDAMTSCLIRDPEDDTQQHVVMPLKL